MSEGEFQKRIRENEAEFKQPVPSWVIKLWIEEARRDFPDFDFVEIQDTSAEVFNMPIAVMVDTNKIREVLAWKKKWFGCGEEPPE